MKSNGLRTDPELDESFAKIKRKIDRIPPPQNFSVIYDYAKRFFNQHGLGVGFIEKIYLLGYIDGKQEAKVKIANKSRPKVSESELMLGGEVHGINIGV